MTVLLNSIKGKIIFALLLIVIAVLSSFEYYQYVQEERHLNQELTEAGEQKAMRLAQNLELPLWELDGDWVGEILATEMMEKETYAIFVYSDGELFTGLSRDEAWLPIDAVNNISGDYVFNSIDVLHEGEKIGTVKLYLSRKFMYEALWNQLVVESMAVVVLSILLIIFLVIAMERIIVSPLESILKIVRLMSSGDYSRDIKTTRQDEIAMVAEGFNLLKRSVQEREADLLHSEERIRLLLDSTAEGIYGLDLEGNCTFANKMCLKLTGYQNVDELIGNNMHNLIHHTRSDGSHYPVEECGIYKAFKSGSGTHVDDEVFWRKDGTSFPAGYSSFPVRKDGEIIGSVVTFSDITEKRQAESSMQTLVASTAEHVGDDFFKAAVENLYHWIDADVVILSELSDSQKARAIAMMADGKFIEDYSYDIKGSPCENVASEGICYFPENIVNLFPEDDELKQLNVESYLGAPIKDQSGKPIGVLCAFSRSKDNFLPATKNVFKIIAARAGVEIERKLLEAQFLQAQKMEAIGTLVGGIAHDFNNTLAGITGNIYLAKSEVRELPETLSRLQDIEALSFRAAGMIQQLLAFSRKGTVNMNPMVISSFLKEIVKMHAVALPESIRLSQDIEGNEMEVLGDINQLQQVIMNLLNNARDAVEGVKAAEIILTLKRFTADDQFLKSHPAITGKEFACISVIDNGSGIETKNLERIFEPFFTTKEAGEGTGLGLAMVYGTILSHGGTISVDSEPGKGTAMHVYLPLLNGDGKQVMAPVDEEVAHGHGETILLVDDDESVLKTGSDLLERLGYKVLLGTNGLHALEAYKVYGNEIGLVILDIVMPKMGGREAAEKILETDENAKIIFVTGYDSHQKIDEDSQETILSKPYKVHEFSQAIKTALEDR
ncbi:MAG: ATP-binding protein [Mariprofundaceae bacterium]